MFTTLSITSTTQGPIHEEAPAPSESEGEALFRADQAAKAERRHFLNRISAAVGGVVASRRSRAATRTA